jgi:hypothetical protein
MTEEPLVLFFVPSLVSVLLGRDREKGEALVREEVLAIRDGATCVALPRSEAAAIAKQRGYRDIDPEKAWEEWCAIRPSLMVPPDDDRDR